MSIGTWKKEFYPTPPTKDMSLLECVNLGIRKFQGATQENLEEHCLFLDGGHLFANESFLGDEVFTFGGKECGFCLKFFDNNCVGCPIQQEFKHTCLDTISGFDAFQRSNNPEPILNELIQIKMNIEEGKDYSI